MDYIRIRFEDGMYIIIVEPRRAMCFSKYLHSDGSIHYSPDSRDVCEIVTSTTGNFKSVKKALKALKKGIKKGNI